MCTCIDSHTHIFPDHVADKAMAALTATYHAQPCGPATAAGLTAAMEQAGVDRAVICPVATRPDQVTSVNRWVAGLDRARFIPFGAMHPGCDNQDDELAFLRDQGIGGVKLQPHFQGYELDEAATLRMFERLGEMVILIHGGQEIRRIEHVPTTPDRLLALHERFPTHCLIVAHLGGYQYWEEVRERLVGQEVYFDLSYTFDRLDDESVAGIIAAHGPERILFASDYPWQPPADARAGLDRLRLPEEQRRMILGGNAAELLGLPSP